MTTIYFVRHGEYKNPNKICPWRTPGFPLSEKGIKDIEKDAEYFKDIKIEAIYSSPIIRAKQSAEIIAKKIHRKVLISKLINKLYSPLQSKPVTLQEFFSDETIPYNNEYHKANGGETIASIHKRVKKLVTKILKKHKNKKVILVFHGDPIIIYLATESGIIIDKRPEGFFGYKYISKAGMIEAKFEKEKLISAKPLNY